MRTRTLTVLISCTAALIAASCSNSDDGTLDATQVTASSETTAGTAEEAANPGVRLVNASDGLAIQSDPPSDLVILDVRTAEEFAEGHLEGAIMLDFYDPAFASQIAELDPNVPYLLYCRSGNRSGRTAELMEQLGFADVADVDGGILAWADAGQTVVTE